MELRLTPSSKNAPLGLSAVPLLPLTPNSGKTLVHVPLLSKDTQRSLTGLLIQPH